MFRSAKRSGSVLPLVVALVLNAVPLLTFVGVVAGAPQGSPEGCICATADVASSPR